MKKFLFVFYMFIIVQAGFGQLSGPLSGTLGPGEYHIVDIISVESTDTLTLMPGTTFNFDGPYPFNIYGTILAEGTETDSIIFTTDTFSNPDRWRGLHFRDSTSSGSCLTYCLIQYSKNLWISGGGCVTCVESAPSFEHCTISDNFSYDEGIWGGGGGLACVRSSATFTHCIIRNNTATGIWSGGGGGVYCFESSSVFRECSIVDNQADDGGGVACQYSSATFKHCIIRNNTATTASGGDGSGGGVICFESPSVFRECSIVDNQADNGGGVACLYSSATFTRCIIRNNTARDVWGGDGRGGGVRCRSVDVDVSTFTNCVIIGNIADDRGGGVCCSEGSAIFNSTIIAFSEGDGIYFNDAAESQITYCNIFANSGENIAFEDGNPNQGPPGIGQIDMTNINGDSCDQYYNIFLDPMFVDTAEGDYHLLAGSPCIDAGDPELPLDPDGTIADIGAFYLHQSSAEPKTFFVPTEYALHPNYPNPFNPVTMIRYDVAQSGPVQLKIYNLLGQQVTTLVDKPHLVGSYTVSWNAGNGPSGLYFCRLQVGNSVQTQKMMLLK